MSLEISFSSINTLFIYGLKPLNTLGKDSVNSPHYLKKKIKMMQPSQVQWLTPSSPVLRRQMQEELCEVKASLIYKAS